MPKKQRHKRGSSDSKIDNTPFESSQTRYEPDESPSSGPVTLNVTEGGRLDCVLVRELNATIKDQGPPVTRSRTQRAIQASHVTLNGKTVTKVGHKCKPKDVLTYRDALRVLEESVEPENIPLDILHEDEHLLVLNKAAGMACHPAGGLRSGTLLNALLHHMGYWGPR